MSKMPHIQLDASIHASAAILPGDPARVDEIAQYLEDVREEGFHREYKSITGTYKGRRILAMSTGMGGPSAAIGFEELADLGVRDMIRIGSCGALAPHLHLGDLVICDRAVCDDGTSQTYLDYLRYASPELDFRADKESNQILYANADPYLTEACAKFAKELGFSSDVGPTRSHDGLYLKRKGMLDHYYSGKGVFASDMETAALFAVGMVRGFRSASILNVVVEWEKDIKEGVGSYTDGAALTKAGEKNEILLALEVLSAAK